jgi:DNA-binding transcriptional MerR regulator
MFVNQDFESRDVVKLVGVTERELRHWCDIKVLLPEVANSVGKPGIRRRYSFENLVDAGIIKALLGHGVTLHQAGQILGTYRSSKYRLMPHPPGSLFLVIQNGRAVVVTNLDSRFKKFLDPRRGQDSFFVIAIHYIQGQLMDQISQMVQR